MLSLGEKVCGFGAQVLWVKSDPSSEIRLLAPKDTFAKSDKQRFNILGDCVIQILLCFE